jgi:hypothetical protein
MMLNLKSTQIQKTMDRATTGLLPLIRTCDDNCLQTIAETDNGPQTAAETDLSQAAADLLGHWGLPQ